MIDQFRVFGNATLAGELVVKSMDEVPLAIEVPIVFADSISGTFDSAAQADQDTRYDHAIWHRVEIWPGDKDARWVYAENWLAGAEKPYRQRISKFRLAEDGSIVSESFRFKDAEQMVSAWSQPGRFQSVDKATLVSAAGCEIRLARTAPRQFEGSTYGQQCRNSYKGASYVVSRSVINMDGFTNWDRGFNQDGEQVWGPKTHGYRFLRSGSSQCNNPVLMLVHGDISDRQRFGAYVKAIADSGLYPANQGYYRMVSPATEIFEGDIPKSRGTVLVRFPCLEAARRFWYSDAYAEIRKLRDGIATFEVSVFRELPVPDYIDWR